MVKRRSGSTRIVFGILLQKIRAAAAELGWFNASLYGADRLLSRLGGAVGIYRYYLVAQPVPDQPLLPARRGRAIDVERMAAGHPGFGGLPLGEDVIAYRFAQEAVCFGAFQDGEIRGCLWLCLGPYDEDEVRCRFVHLPESETAWDFDVYVCPDARVGFAFGRLWDEANAFLREKGVSWSMSRISAFNPGSLASHTRLGARRVGSAIYLKLGGWQVTIADVAPYMHLSTGAGSVPRLRVGPMKNQGR